MRSIHTLCKPVRFTLFMAFSGCILFVALCLPQTLSAQNFDYRAVNLVDGLSGMDAHFFDLEAATINNLEFAHASKVQPSLPSMAGSFSVKYANAGAGVSSSFVEGSETVQSGYEYTGIAYGSSSTPTLKILERNKSQGPASGKALLRVVHAASFTEAIDVHLGQVEAVPTLAGVTRDDATTFQSVDAEATALIITEAGGQTPLVRLTAPLGSGTPFVTLIITGTRNNLTVYALFDADPTKHQLILLEESSYTNARVVHLRPNADVSGGGEKLDVYLNKATLSDTKVSDTLKYRRASRDFGPLFTDSFQVKFVPSGESPIVSVRAF